MAIAYNSSIVTSGLVLCLDAGSPRSYAGSGTICKDVSTNNAVGTLVNGVGYNSANLGSFVYDGVDDNITFPDSSAIAITGDMSILAWVTVTNFSNYRSIVGKTPPSSVPAPYDYYLISGSGVPTLYRGNGSANANVSGTSAPATGVWQYVAVTMTGTSVVHYLNGNTNGSGTLSTTIANNASYPLNVGNRQDGVTRMLGKYGILQLYNIGLTASQVLQNFNATRGRYGI